MTQRVTRQMFERRYEQRARDEAMYSVYQAKIKAEQADKVQQETDERSALRRKAARQRIADEEFAMAEKIYNQQKAYETRRREMEEQDAIAQALAEQTQAEVRDQKMRALLRENDAEIRELKSKLQTALITQTRDKQIKEAEKRRKEEQQERIEEEQMMMRNYRREEAARAMEEEAKHANSLATRAFIQEQLRDKERRRQLLEVAERKRDEQQVNEIVARVQREDAEREAAYRQKQQRNYAEMKEFMAARQAMKERERQEQEEENRKIAEFSMNVDERLRRAQEEQKRRDAQREAIGRRIAEDIHRKQKEDEEYEQLCLDLAEQQELQKLQDREKAEAEKIKRQIEDCKVFMEQSLRAKAAEKERTRIAELKLKQQMAEEQKRLNELAAVEQENARIKNEKYRRELTRQMLQKREMYEAARAQELRKLQLEQEREDERQRILNEERRKLVINHILSMGADAVKYLPQGVLKEEDLDYLPEEYRIAILNTKI